MTTETGAVNPDMWVAHTRIENTPMIVLRIAYPDGKRTVYMDQWAADRLLRGVVTVLKATIPEEDGG